LISADSDMRTYLPEGERVHHFLNPVRIVRHLLRHRQLIYQLTRREVAIRYRGSFLGIAWALIQPFMMLYVYTFVFSVIFQARWGVSGGESRVDFAMALFIGMISFSVFAEVANTAPLLILNNVNYVKKVVFPLEILIVVRLLSTLINALFALLVLACGILAFYHSFHWTVVLLPVVWLPLICLTLGCGYFLASFGVFIRDLGAAVNILTTMLFFLTPIFYPISAVPEQFRIFSRLNPLAAIVEDARRVVLWGITPEWPFWGIGLAAAVLVWILGFVWFVKSKRAFADVV